VRWWNVAHPRAYAQRLATGLSPEAGRETPDAEAQVIERVMLGIRLTEGLSVADIPAAGRDAIVGLIADGLVDEVPGAGSGTGSGSGLGAERGAVPGTTLGAAPTAAGRVRLTLRGRLLADVVTRALIG
jgi:oxygen-independent coproporphyrinogen-3 oxidase